MYDDDLPLLQKITEQMKTDAKFREEMQKIARDCGFNTVSEAFNELRDNLLVLAFELLSKTDVLINTSKIKLSPEIKERLQEVRIYLNYLKIKNRRESHD